MEDLLKSLSLNNLYRYFLPGALVSYYFAWRWEQKLQLLPKTTIGLSIFVLVSFGIGSFIYLLYRGLLHPRWCTLQYRWRSIPAFDIYRKLIKELGFSDQREKTYDQLLQSQTCLGAFFSLDKYKDWQGKNEFRISSVHFLYLITTTCLLILFLELIFLIPPLKPCEHPPLIVIAIIIFSGATTLIVGEFYDKIADVSEGQFLSAHIDEYQMFIMDTYHSIDSYKLLINVEKGKKIWWLIISYFICIIICLFLFLHN